MGRCRAFSHRSLAIRFRERATKTNLNKGAGLDVSRLYAITSATSTDVTDWRFVDFSEVPRGPWSTLGENNTFVINDRKKGATLVEKLGTIAH